MATPSYGPRKSIGLAALLPLVTVLFWSFGMGSALLIWLLIRRIPPIPGVSPGVFDGFIVVDEGNKTGSTQLLDGQEEIESTMRGVLIITAISHFSSMAVVPLMALGAFYVAAKWLDDRANSKKGPTPLQFGLIMQMCSSGTWDSVLTTSKYLFQHWRSKSASRTQVSPIVYRALIIASAVVFLHYGVVATDLWLTAEIGSVYYSTASTVDITSSSTASLLGTQYNARVDPQAYWQAFFDTIIISTFDEYTDVNYKPGGDKDYYYQGIDTMNGRSTSHHIILVNTSTSSSLKDTSSMAILVRPPSNIPSQWSWTAPSIGMTTRCQPALCDQGNVTVVDLVTCTNLTNTYHPMPLPSFPYPPLVPPLTRRGRFKRYDPITGDEQAHWTPEYEAWENHTNPSCIVINVQMYGSGWDPRTDFSEVGQMWQHSERLRLPLYLGTCEVSLYDVEVSFNGSPSTGGNGNMDINSQYILNSSPVFMAGNRSARILSPIRARYSSDAISVLDPIIQLAGNNVVGDTVTPGFSNRFSAEFAKQYLGFISSMVEAIPAITVRDNSPKLVSRYPMAGTMSYIVVVYAHGLLAIILFIGIIGRLSNSVEIADPVWRVNLRGVPVPEKEKPVQELLLVHLRITDPLAVVAEHFSDPDLAGKPWATSTSAGALSALKDPIEIFGIEDANTMRVEVGLIDDRNVRRRFGLKHRWGDIVV